MATHHDDEGGSRISVAIERSRLASTLALNTSLM